MEFTLLIIILNALIMIAGPLITNYFRKKIRENIALLGQRLNLEYKFNKLDFFSSLLRYTHPELVGIISERYPIRIHSIVKQRGKRQVNYIAFDLDCRTNKPYRFSGQVLILGIKQKASPS